MPKSVLATGYDLLQQLMKTFSHEVVQHKLVAEIDNLPVYFVISVIRDVGQHRIKNGRVDDTEKTNVLDEPLKSRR